MIAKYLVSGILAAVVTGQALAQYPNKPVRIIHPFTAGGGSDVVVRYVAQELSEATGKTFLVENKTGAGGRIGYDAGAKALPDGYTLVTSETSYTMLPGLFGAALTWNPDADIVPVTTFAQVPMVVIVSPKLGVKSLREFIALAKANPGKFNYGSAGIGSINHIVAELFKREAGIDLTHVPFKGGGDMVVGLLSGAVDLIIQSPVAVIPHVTKGTMTALAIASTRRLESLPDVPTVVEAGLPTYVVGTWFGLAAPKGTPSESINWLYREIAKVVASPKSKERFAQLGATPYSIPPDELGNLMLAETRRWSDVIRAAQIKAE